MIRLMFAVLMVLSIGCDDYKILSGQWFSEEPMPPWHFKPDDEPSVYLELTLGHYGKDVVGVARYYTKAFQDPNSLRSCDGDLVPLECTCTEVMGAYHIDKRRLRIYLNPYCNEDGGELVEMVLVDDDTLRWIVPPVDGQIAKEIRFERTLDEGALTKGDKTCEPCQ